MGKGQVVCWPPYCCTNKYVHQETCLPMWPTIWLKVQLTVKVWLMVWLAAWLTVTPADVPASSQPKRNWNLYFSLNENVFSTGSFVWQCFTVSLPSFYCLNWKSCGRGKNLFRTTNLSMFNIAWKDEMCSIVFRWMAEWSQVVGHAAWTHLDS